MARYQRKVELPGKSAQHLYDRIASDIDRFLAKIPMGSFDVDRDQAKREVRVKSSMAKATLVCLEGSIEVQVDLSLMATPFRSKLDAGIDHWLAKTFGKQA